MAQAPENRGLGQAFADAPLSRGPSFADMTRPLCR